MPKMRNIAFTIQANQLEIERQSPWFNDGFWQTCLSCDHFNEKQELCNKWKSRPPARVIAFGCESYSDDNSIPF